jgi:hypothetical protein
MGFFLKTPVSVVFVRGIMFLGQENLVGHFLDRFYPTGAHFRATSWENRGFGVFGHLGRALRQGKSIFLQTF